MHELKLIEDFYAGGVAKRTQVPLIFHIYDGIRILHSIDAPMEAKQAFCLHPLIQDDYSYELNIQSLIDDPEIDSQILKYAIDYRVAANAYLCRPETDAWNAEKIYLAVGELSPVVKQMLIADKQQNLRDFMRYHYGTHPRSLELTRYFINWLEFLGVLGVP